MEYKLEDFLEIIGEEAKQKAMMQATINILKRENEELKAELANMKNEEAQVRVLEREKELLKKI